MLVSPFDALPSVTGGSVPLSELNVWEDWLSLLVRSAFTREFAISAALVFGSPFLWTVISRLEYSTRFLTRLFRSKVVACYAFGTFIFSFSTCRNLYFEYYVKQAPQVDLSDHPVLASGVDLLGYLSMAVGAVFVASSSWQLGFLSTMYSDRFGLLMEERITSFPFSVLDNPMYVGSTLLFLSLAVIGHSPGGLLLVLWVHIVYRVSASLEEPFTAMIYDEEARRKEQEIRLREGWDETRYNVEAGDIENWSTEEVSYWLRESMGMDHLVRGFKENDVDGTVLCRLTLEMLRDDLGVASLGQRFKISDTAREIRREYFAKLEKRRGNRWISERRAIEQKVKESLSESIGEIRLIGVIGERVKKMARRITSRSPVSKRTRSSGKRKDN